MKFFVLLAAISLAQAAKLDRVYLPPNAQAASGSDSSLQTPFQSNNGEYDQNADVYANAPTSNVNNFAENDYSGLESRPERTQSAFERNAGILRQDSSNDGETYSYAYETENGIYAEENGVATNGVQAQGGYSYTGDDGKVYSVRYTADENGFVPQGDHLPTPPPIPEEILRALEQNARDEAAGIYDDGSYSDGKYTAASNDQQQYYNTNAQASNYNDDTISNNAAGFGNAANFNGNAANFNGNAADFNANAAAFNDNAAAFNGNTADFNGNTAAFNGNAAAFNGNTAAVNGNTADFNGNTAAFNGNAAAFNGNTAAVNGNAAAFNGNAADFSASSVEKAYLPPVARNNNQRNSNLRNGY